MQKKGNLHVNFVPESMAIVGAIAAMTIPTLAEKRVQTERTAKLRKFYSRMTNAVDLMTMNGKSFKFLSLPSNSTKLYNWYMADLDRYMGHKYLDEGEQTIYFADASSLRLKGNLMIQGCWPVLYDTNGAKLPNTVNSDQYYFVFCFSPTNRREVFGHEDIFFGAYAYNVTGTTSDEDFISSCKREATSQKAKCTKWLQNNNWEYPPGYPFR